LKFPVIREECEVSEKHIASIFRVKEKAKQGTSRNTWQYQATPINYALVTTEKSLRRSFKKPQYGYLNRHQKRIRGIQNIGNLNE
jgi:predicted metalloprotease with PDZ domain